ncbi:flagellar basal body rod protein FlgB [Anaerovorax sp. IOR16]|uniref:flagellar basal body rod protein FlgB n=1 Tax=Anaerovorax sp. IOR16 TaxID=2773458 RepID=UPI0019D07C13|nr:flagellar basal body rod protein FlgB [Anaerovorax sp. IOR16]
MDWLNTNSMLLTEKTLDNLWQRQRLTLQNIANAETPGYKAKYATFEEELNLSLSKFDKKRASKAKEIGSEIQNSKLWIHQSSEESMRLDGNNVQVDVENLELARAQIQYEYALRQATEELNRLRTVITGS